MKYFIQFIAFVIFALCSCGNEQNEVIVVDEDVFITDENNIQLKTAVREAQKSLDYFIKKYNKYGNDVDYWFSTKTYFEYPEEVEHMWFETMAIKEDTLIGTLIGEPSIHSHLKINDTVRIHRDQIEDWFIECYSDSTIEGDYTEKHLFNEDNKANIIEE